MASVFKRGGKSNRGGYWYISWYDHNGKRHSRCTRTTDKAAAERIAAKYEGEAALRRDGVINPAEDRYAAQNRRPIAEHVADFRAALEAKGNAADYIAQAKARVQAILEACSVAISAT